MDRHSFFRHVFYRVWRQTRLQMQMKLRLYQTCILPILLHGSEAWTLLQEDLRKLEAFYMRCRRMILGIRWHDFVRNTEVIATTNLPSVPETHCSVMWRDLMIIFRFTVHCPKSRQLEPVPALTPAGADAQASRATREYSSSATVPLSASALYGPRHPVMGIPG